MVETFQLEGGQRGQTGFNPLLIIRRVVVWSATSCFRFFGSRSSFLLTFCLTFMRASTDCNLARCFMIAAFHDPPHFSPCTDLCRVPIKNPSKIPGSRDNIYFIHSPATLLAKGRGPFYLESCLNSS
uniref:Uncharacterized protein n=1 Tax=Takifugu rubripes TaxID=31033 RepID=A0A674N9D0_TAKRU